MTFSSTILSQKRAKTHSKRQNTNVCANSMHNFSTENAELSTTFQQVMHKQNCPQKAKKPLPQNKFSNRWNTSTHNSIYNIT
nr:MAG TPA: hypothetical protein [Caudoviricetes sp.]